MREAVGPLFHLYINDDLLQGRLLLRGSSEGVVTSQPFLDPTNDLKRTVSVRWHGGAGPSSRAPVSQEEDVLVDDLRPWLLNKFATGEGLVHAKVLKLQESNWADPVLAEHITTATDLALRALQPQPPRAQPRGPVLLPQQQPQPGRASSRLLQGVASPVPTAAATTGAAAAPPSQVSDAAPAATQAAGAVRGAAQKKDQKRDKAGAEALLTMAGKPAAKKQKVAPVVDTSNTGQAAAAADEDDHIMVLQRTTPRKNGRPAVTTSGGSPADAGEDADGHGGDKDKTSRRLFKGVVAAGAGARTGGAAGTGGAGTGRAAGDKAGAGSKSVGAGNKAASGNGTAGAGSGAAAGSKSAGPGRGGGAAAGGAGPGRSGGSAGRGAAAAVAATSSGAARGGGGDEVEEEEYDSANEDDYEDRELWVKGWSGINYPATETKKHGDLPVGTPVEQEVEGQGWEYETFMDEVKVGKEKFVLIKWKGWELDIGRGYEHLRGLRKGHWESLNTYTDDEGFMEMYKEWSRNKPEWYTKQQQKQQQQQGKPSRKRAADGTSKAKR